MPRLRSLLLSLVSCLALSLLVPARLGAQGGQVTFIRSALEPLPPCQPALTINQSQAQVWDLIAQKMMTCTGINTWTALGTGGQGTITGGGTTNTFALWSGPTAIGNAPMTVAGGVTLSANPFSITGPLLFPCANAASGTTQGLLVTADANGNCINLPNGNTGKIVGVCFSGCGTSGTAQIAYLSSTPVIFDNQTAINDYVVAGANSQAHDAGATYPTGVQVIGIVGSVNSGGGTTANANITILNILNPTGSTGHAIQVNAITTAGATDNFSNTTPAAQANFLNLTFQTDNAAPTSNISVEVPLSTTAQQGVVKLAQDLGGTSLLPKVIGIQAIPVTFTTPAARDSFCFSTPTTLANCKFGVPPRSVSGTTDTVLSTDRAGWVIYTNAGAVTVTQPSAASLGGSNFVYNVTSNGGGSVTVTANGSETFIRNNTSATGTSTLVVTSGTWCQITEDDGSPAKWYADCSGGGVGGGGVVAPPSPSIRTVTGAYTIQDSDNTWRIKANSGANAITLPQAGTIGASPLVSVRYSATVTTGPSFVSSTFAQTAGHSLIVELDSTAIAGNNYNGITSISDTAGDTFTLLMNKLPGSTEGFDVYIANNIASAASNAVTVTLGNTINQAIYVITEWQNLSTGTVATATGATSVSVPITFVNAMGYGTVSAHSGTGYFGGALPGWTQVSGGSNQDISYKLVANQSSFLYPGTTGGATATMGVAQFGIASAPTFVSGWYTTVENSGNNGAAVVVTPTTSTINGQTTLVIPNGMFCQIMSDGANYNAICGFMSNTSAGGIPGILGSPIEVGGVNTSNTASDVGATTLFATTNSDALYQVNAAIVCRSSVNASETVTITYTDTNSIVQSGLTATTGVCNGGSPANGLITSTFRAKSGTNIQYTTTHTTATPNYDVSVAIFQLSTK